MLQVLAWEEKVADKLSGVRRKELRRLRKLLLVRSVNFVVATLTPVIIAASTFITYHQMGNQLTASKVRLLPRCSASNGQSLLADSSLHILY